jgi:hypothetical protein
MNASEYPDHVKAELQYLLAEMEIARAGQNKDNLIECMQSIVQMVCDLKNYDIQKISEAIMHLIKYDGPQGVIDVEKRFDSLLTILRDRIDNI